MESSDKSSFVELIPLQRTVPSFSFSGHPRPSHALCNCTYPKRHQWEQGTVTGNKCRKYHKLKQTWFIPKYQTTNWCHPVKFNSSYRLCYYFGVDPWVMKTANCYLLLFQWVYLQVQAGHQLPLKLSVQLGTAFSKWQTELLALDSEHRKTARRTEGKGTGIYLLTRCNSRYRG
jgi:hypothetical protein